MEPALTSRIGRPPGPQAGSHTAHQFRFLDGSSLIIFRGTPMEHQAFKRVNACQIQMRQGGNLPRQLQNMPAGYAGAPGTCIHFQTHFAGKTSFSGRPAQRGGSLQAVNRQDQPFHPFCSSRARWIRNSPTMG